MDKSAWRNAYSMVWNSLGSSPSIGLIVTNSGNNKAPEGTPIFGSIGTSGILTVSTTYDHLEFEFDHTKKVVTVLYGREPKDRRELLPLTQEQLGIFGVDFGGQFSS